MGNTIIPHTFVAGTKAKASEVNENFIAVKDALEKKAEDIGDPLKTFSVADAEEDTHAVSKGQLEAAKSEMSDCINTKGCVYCLKSGNITNGKADLFGFDGLEIIPKVGDDDYPELVVTALDGHSFVKSSLNTISMVEKSDGNYNIFIPEEGDAYVYKNVIYIQSEEPSSPILNDVWIDTSLEPLSGQKYSGTIWEDFEDVPAGKIVIEEGAVTSVETAPYNQNGYFLNSESFSPKTDITNTVINFAMPDYTKIITQAFGVTYTAMTDGYVFYIGGQRTQGMYCSIMDKDGNELLHANEWLNNNGGADHHNLFPIAKGCTYVVGGGSGASYNLVKFIPAKGAV